MVRPAGQAYCWVTCLGWYREVAWLEVATGNWRLLEEWCLGLPDNLPGRKSRKTCNERVYALWWRSEVKN